MKPGGWPSWSSCVLCVVESLESSWEWIGVGKVHQVLKRLLIFVILILKIFPWFPVLHYSQQFDFVVSLEDKLFDQARGDFVFDRTHGKVLIDDVHSKPGQLLAQGFVAVYVWQVLELLQGNVVEFHQLHSWEWFDIQKCNTS